MSRDGAYDAVKPGRLPCSPKSIHQRAPWEERSIVWPSRSRSSRHPGHYTSATAGQPVDLFGSRVTLKLASPSQALTYGAEHGTLHAALVHHTCRGSGLAPRLPNDVVEDKKKLTAGWQLEVIFRSLCGFAGRGSRTGSTVGSSLLCTTERYMGNTQGHHIMIPAMLFECNGSMQFSRFVQ